MKHILFLGYLLSLAAATRHTIDVYNLSRESHSVLSDYFEYDDSNIRDNSLELSELKSYIKNQKQGEVLSIHFNCEKCRKSHIRAGIELQTDPSKVKGIKLAVLASDNHISAINVGLSNEAHDSVDFIESTPAEAVYSNQEFKIPTKEPERPIGGAEPEKPVEEEKSFLKKYFWYIVIGGMVIMNIASFDKNKLGEAYNQAQQQAQPQRR